VLGLVFASGIEFFNNSLRTEEDVEHYLALPVLAVIRDSGENRALPLNA
jgi:capsular polysaccharide biosynthesis protein